MGMIKHKPLRATRNDEYIFTLQFETNNTDAPDGLVPAYGTDVLAIDQTATGTYTITFAESKKPYALHYAQASFLEDMPGWSINVVSYVQSTGVLTLKAYDEDNTSGVAAAADSTDKTVQLFCVFTRSSVTGIV